MFFWKKSYKAEISTSSNTFYKGIYLKEQIGVFIYFLNEDSIQPKIIIKNFKDDNIQDFNLYNNDQNINIRYYKIPIYEQNHYMIYKEIRLFLYINQYITF